MNKSLNRYVREFLISMAAYVVVLWVSITLVNNSPSTAWWRYPLVLTPIIPAIFALMAFLRYLAKMDELQRRIQLEAIGFSFGCTAILTFSYGFLEGAGFPHLSWIWILPLMIMLWGVGLAVSSRRYV